MDEISHPQSEYSSFNPHLQSNLKSTPMGDSIHHFRGDILHSHSNLVRVSIHPQIVSISTIKWLISGLRLRSTKSLAHIVFIHKRFNNSWVFLGRISIIPHTFHAKRRQILKFKKKKRNKRKRIF